jgi:hypothetical protein
MRKSPLVGVSVAVLGMTGALLVAASNATADPTTLIVGNPVHCAGAQYTTISAAVAAATSGDTIKVCAGVYGEHVEISTPNLTLEGVAAGKTAVGRSGAASTISNAAGDITIAPSADNTTIDGFTIENSVTDNADGINDFGGSSGLTLVNNIIKLNAIGVNLQNPDGTQPALIQDNAFLNNTAGGDPATDAGTGTAIFISNGPANNTTIVGNKFNNDSQTAINFAGSSSQPSVGLLVEDNTSLNDSTFVVATNSTGAVIDGNQINTTSSKVPGGEGHGTGILDFGGNTALRITNNRVTGAGASTSSGISVSNFSGANSEYTDVISNIVSGYATGIKVVSGNTSAYVYGNRVRGSSTDGIVVQSGTSGVVITKNTVTASAPFACEDDSTGHGTAGTANTWTKNTGTSASSPAKICSAAA